MKVYLVYEYAGDYHYDAREIFAKREDAEKYIDEEAYDEKDKEENWCIDERELR